jgi:hypothetical protein
MMLALALLGLTQAPRTGGFDHLKHAKLFPTCTTCHAAAASRAGGASMWPDPASCASCHDGVVQRTVAWRLPNTMHAGNLRFDHQAHAAAVQDSQPACTVCHTESGAPPMAVRSPIVSRCFDCHGGAQHVAHLAAPDSACATCHVTLARAVGLTRGEIARFPAPPSHGAASWPTRAGHGTVARAAVGTSCATCHAREFCYECHAGGSPPRVIAALASDPRSTAIAVRRAPASHGANFADRHGPIAAAREAACASCHVRADCLECHRASAGAASGYHPAGFLARHPAAAYARETSCSDCHSERSFCADCHARAGLVANRGLRTGYHDARQFFVSGHGGAARQSLESCVSCHTERDCLSCHSALGGRRFNPHGPGFDAARLRRKNFEMCTVCHGAAVPQ